MYDYLELATEIDIDDDAEDYARSDEEGWFYDDGDGAHFAEYDREDWGLED